MRRVLALLALFSLLIASACGGDELLLATTTSVRDTGLLDELLAAFEKEAGINVKAIVVGSGQALELGRRGEVDALFTHAPQDEERFIAEGDGINRREVMRNDFVIVGPTADPAGIRGLTPAWQALKRISEREAVFFSRGDRSGTHQMEMRLWQEAGVVPQGRWYQEAGQGMAQTLLIADAEGGYTLTDRSTFIVMREHLRLAVLVEDARLVNIYSVMQVNPERHSHVNAEAAAAFVDFVASERGQQIIAGFGAEEFGEPLFVPAATLGAGAEGGH